jgi:hypothetical protein
MSNKFYFTFLFILFVSLSVIYYFLNHNIGHVNWPSPAPGRPLSIKLGWAGFIIMLLTNLYVFRKRVAIFQKRGSLANWLNFHIFCGLVGPTFILFHSNFKVRGLVAISFWSMVISVSSGVIGRYFYVQISKLKGDFLREAEALNSKLLKLAATHNVSEPEYFTSRRDTLILAGANNYSANPLIAFFKSSVGDINLMFKHIPSPSALGHEGSVLLKNYALATRKANTIDSFNKLMGFWHTFHMPFGFFMYFTAIFHVVAALMFGV